MKKDSSNLIENFPCPPAKIKLLKKKLARFMNSRVDPDTRQLQPIATDDTSAESLPSHIDHIHTSVNVLASEQQPHPTLSSMTPTVDQPKAKRRIVIDNELIRDEHLTYLRSGMPFFRDLTDLFGDFGSMEGDTSQFTATWCSTSLPRFTLYSYR